MLELWVVDWALLGTKCFEVFAGRGSVRTLGVQLLHMVDMHT